MNPDDDDGEIGLLDGLATTRSIRRYTDEPVLEDHLKAILFAATRAPSGSNRQPFRFVVLADGPNAIEAKRLIGESARAMWNTKRKRDGYDSGSGTAEDSPKARMARSMQRYVDEFETVPVLILPCLVRYREPNLMEGASIYPACQNLLLAARGLGYGGALTGWHDLVDDRLHELLAIPAEVVIAATITLGKPEGAHGPVRRRPMRELIFDDAWDASVNWDDPPGTRHTSAGPKRSAPKAGDTNT